MFVRFSSWLLLGCCFVIPCFAQENRVVALEFSFAEDLVAIGVHPVGIADDGRRGQLHPKLQALSWTSVGTRAQPNLERISALHPTLIIADSNRHQLIADQLRAIAPTLLLPSRRAGYQDNLIAARRIGEVLGKAHVMNERLKYHQQLLQQFAMKLHSLHNQSILFMINRGPSLFAHARDSYVGGIISALSLTPADTGFSDDQPNRQINIEQLLAINPAIILLGQYGHQALDSRWQQDRLWHALTAVRSNHIFAVNANIWVKGRGILSAEQIARTITMELIQSHHD